MLTDNVSSPPGALQSAAAAASCCPTSCSRNVQKRESHRAVIVHHIYCDQIVTVINIITVLLFCLKIPVVTH